MNHATDQKIKKKRFNSSKQAFSKIDVWQFSKAKIITFDKY